MASNPHVAPSLRRAGRLRWLASIRVYAHSNDTLGVDDQTLGTMVRKPDDEQPLTPPERLPGPPTQPGWYWWKSDCESREIMVQANLTNGELTVWWSDKDTPVAKLKGSWRGPIP